MRLFVFLLAALVPVAHGQSDERRVVSPDGSVEFRISIAPPESGDYLQRLAYEVWAQGKPVIARSYLGLDIWLQEPLLGENDGITGTSRGSGPGYNSLAAHYMQNGSIGRLLDIEARAYNDGVAFRYALPLSTPLQELLITDEATEFRFTHAIQAPLQQKPPLVVNQPGGGWVGITEVPLASFPAMLLARLDSNAVVTRLPPMPNRPGRAYEGATPFTGPWRVIAFGKDGQSPQDLDFRAQILHFPRICTHVRFRAPEQNDQSPPF